MLELKDISLRLDGRPLFSHFSLMAYDGQLTCVTGPAGSGKTALVRLMLGFLAPDEGVVSIDGEVLTALSAPAFRQLMVYVAQPEPVSAPFVPDTSGLETLWGGFSSALSSSRPLTERLSVAEPSLSELPPGKRIVIADEPAPALYPRLKQLAAEGLTVVVASREDSCASLSDKTITLPPDEHQLH